MLLQLRERVLHRQQGSYILTVEAGRSLLLSADTRAESTLQTELMEIQERWRHAHHRLDQQRRELNGLLKVRLDTSHNPLVFNLFPHELHFNAHKISNPLCFQSVLIFILYYGCICYQNIPTKYSPESLFSL